MNKELVDGLLATKVNTNFCTRCGRQLHHNMRVCPGCGKDNPWRPGLTLIDVLRILHNRDYMDREVEYSPEFVYEIFKWKLLAAGIEEDEFVQYVNSLIQ